MRAPQRVSTPPSSGLGGDALIPSKTLDLTRPLLLLLYLGPDGDGAVAGPLTGACAPQRVSAPPSSDLVAAPLARAPARAPTRRQHGAAAR